MEKGSGSLGESLGSSTESLNGLKFGQKIYFEDVGSGVPAKSGTGSSSSSSGSPAPARRPRGGGVVQGGQPPRCQVEGCKVDLSDAKAYYSRHKVCGMHSKSPKVIVAGLEQRFCQQCSRFHLLPEFDQGKRSCRRRLAGHNERRRRPPPGSLLSPRYGSRLSPSSIFENNSRVGSFMMDFTSYPRFAGRGVWPPTRSPDRAPPNHTAAMGRSLSNPWQSSSENPSSELFAQNSTGGAGFSSPGIASGVCFTAVADSSCALSLLSNQPWDSRNRSSSLGINDLVNAEEEPMPQPAGPHGPSVNHYSDPLWSLKGNEASNSLHEMPPDLGLGQISESVNCEFSGGLELPQHGRRQYMDIEPSRAYDNSTRQMHWSL